MPYLLRKGIPSKMKFDGLHSTGNRYYVGLINIVLAGLHGSDKMLYVLESSKLKFNYLLNCYDPAQVILNSVPIAKATLMLKTTVIQYIAYNEMGISRSIPIILEPLEKKEIFAHTQVRLTTNLSTGTLTSATVQRIVVHPYSLNMESSQYYDIYLNLVHEKYHADNPADTQDEVSSECHAYEKVMNHHYFRYASFIYQRHVYREFDKYERLFLSGR